MLMWVMSDRAIPRSYATMEGFGVHTFRLVAADGSTSLVKWHWKPVAGIHSLVWEESQKLGGIDPDFHRRDLHARIATGNLPQWELGVQVMPDTDGPDLRGHRPARRHQDRARGAVPGPHRRHADARPQPGELLRRDRAGRVPPRPPRARHRLRRRPAAARPPVLVPRHAAHPPRRAELLADPDQPADRPGQRQQPRRLHAAGRPRGRRAVHAELARRRLPVRAGRRRRLHPRRRARSTARR